MFSWRSRRSEGQSRNSDATWDSGDENDANNNIVCSEWKRAMKGLQKSIRFEIPGLEQKRNVRFLRASTACVKGCAETVTISHSCGHQIPIRFDFCSHKIKTIFEV